MTTALTGSVRTLTLCTGVLLCSGCFRWAPVSAPFPENRGWEYVRVVRHDSSSVTLDNARVVDDTLTGVHSGGTPGAGTRARIPVADISSLDESRAHVLKTAGATVAVFAGGIAVLALWLYGVYSGEGDF
jgi:hypothetical protein